MITNEGWEIAAVLLGVEVAAIKAVAEVEAPNGGFNPEGFPITLFEGHWFYRLTKGKFSNSHPSLCYSKWTRRFYGKGWKEEGARLQIAVGLDREAALMSASWGKFQIMGFNHGLCGFPHVQEFVNEMCKDEDSQLRLFCEYVKNSGLSKFLRNHNWDNFARLYNGPEYRKNMYAEKLQIAYEKYKLSMKD